MTKTFHLLCGKLRVEARGYWYSSGGEKGSFGHYPHLKTPDGYPVYADTQIHGDLRMAARWAESLGLEPGLIDKIFGAEGRSQAALLHVGDLILSEASKAEWRAGRFNVKSRIEMDDGSRTVRDKMLASFEAAWLQGLTLEAPLYVGYFASRDEMTRAKRLLEESVPLLSGFGALRSRGYGRGAVSIVWDQEEEAALIPSAVAGGAFTFHVENLVNMRSKPVSAEQLQLVGSQAVVTAEQLRGWLVRTYNQVTGEWPTPEDMATIRCSNLYPTKSADTLSFIPPVTTLRREDGASIEDYWGRMPEENQSSYAGGDTSRESENQATQEGRDKCKLKPLGTDQFVTWDGKVHSFHMPVRMRNAMREDFRTLEKGGLFAQQYLPANTLFGGEVWIRNAESEFARTVAAILMNFKPVINGTLFRSTLRPAGRDVADPQAHHLVTQPIPFNPQCRAEGSGLHVGTQRRYSPVLRRPRRGRPMVLPGSVLVGEPVEGTRAWPKFGRSLEFEAKEKREEKTYQRPVVDVPFPGVKIEWGKISRSQAGILRNLLNPGHDRSVIKKHLDGIHSKQNAKGEESPLALLYGELLKIYEADSADKEHFYATLRKILTYLKVHVWWNKGANGNQNQTGRDV